MSNLPEHLFPTFWAPLDDLTRYKCRKYYSNDLDGEFLDIKEPGVEDHNGNGGVGAKDNGDGGGGDVSSGDNGGGVKDHGELGKGEEERMLSRLRCACVRD